MGALPVRRPIFGCLAPVSKEKIMSDKLGPAPTAAAVAEHSVTLTGDQATQGIKLGHVRYVLAAGLVLAVIAGVIVAMFFTH